MHTKNGTKYPYEDISSCSTCSSKNPTAGFRRLKNGNYADFRKWKKLKSIVVIESETENGEQAVQSFATMLKKFFTIYHIADTGILFARGKIKPQEVEGKRILFLSFNDKITAMPRGVVLGGACEFEVSPLPKTLPNDQYCEFYSSFGFDFREIDGKIVAKDYFADLGEFERKMLNFCEFTKNFDKINSTMSRIIVHKMTIPVQNTEYFTELLDFLPAQSDYEDFDSVAGEMLSVNRGAIVRVDYTREDYEKDTACIVCKFVEDVNG